MTAVTLFLPSALKHEGTPRTPSLIGFDGVLTPRPCTSTEGLR
jgi:hypothetical protein